MLLAMILAALFPGNAYCADDRCYEVNEYCSPDGADCWLEMDSYDDEARSMPVSR